MSRSYLIIAAFFAPLLLLAGALTVTAAQTPTAGTPPEPHAVRQTLQVDGDNPSCDDVSGSPAYCTIQAAVDATGAGDTVQVAAATYTENVLIPAGSDLTVAGDDATTTLVDGGAAERVFRIFSGSTVTLTHLGIANGSHALGAGVYAISSEVRIERSLLYGNAAGTGGGLFAFDSDVTVQNCAIFDNDASDDGGGIAVEGDGSLVVNDSGVSDNEAARGGGIYALDVSLDLDVSRVLSNTAGVGGGIFRNRGYLGAFSSVIQGNTATAGSGGGIATDDETAAATFLEIVDTRILSNTADSHGGGVYLGDGPSKSLSLQDSDVMYNRTESDGAGLDVEGGFLFISDSVIQENVAADDGGAGYLYSAESDAIVENSTIRGNVAGGNGGGFLAVADEGAALRLNRSFLVDNRSGEEGGALFAERAELNQSTVFSNTAVYGGGVYLEATLAGANSTVSGNTAVEEGGGLYADGYLDLNGMTVVSNTATTGGGLAFDGGASADVQKTLLAHNVATGGNAPDCHAGAAATVTSLGYNLVGIANGCDGVFLDGQNGDQAGSYGNPLAAGILSLANNGGYGLPGGGATPTHALRAHSPAVDVIPVPTFCGADQTDQRGVLRAGQDGNNDGGADGDGCDVGAFERRDRSAVYLPITLRQ